MPIIIHTHETERPLIGKSHWWGAPDLPADTPFPYVTLDDGTPEPLTFVCQIRCEDLAAHDPEGLLPHEGMLYVFAPLDHYLGDMDSPLDYHTKPCVFYTRRTDNLQPYEMCWEGTDESVFQPAEEIEFEYTAEASGDGHRMLTLPYEDEVTEQHAGQLCLLQIDEDDRWSLRFYDCGSYFVFLPDDNLKPEEWQQTDSAMFYY